MCLVTLAGCGITRQKPQYIAELRLPYVGPTDHKKLEVSYHFQNTDVRVGEFPSIGHLVLKVYNENDEMLGYEIINAYDVYRKQKYWDRPLFGRIKERKEVHVKNYDYYRNIQEKEWNKSNCHDKMDLVSTGRDKVHTYLNNTKKEYNSGYDELTDEKLSAKTELFEKWDYRWQS